MVNGERKIGQKIKTAPTSLFSSQWKGALWAVIMRYENVGLIRPAMEGNPVSLLAHYPHSQISPLTWLSHQCQQTKSSPFCPSSLLSYLRLLKKGPKGGRRGGFSFIVHYLNQSLSFALT